MTPWPHSQRATGPKIQQLLPSRPIVSFRRQLQGYRGFAWAHLEMRGEDWSRGQSAAPFLIFLWDKMQTGEEDLTNGR